MKVAILGAGFSGLSAAYHLSSRYEVTVFEKETLPGGLAISFKLPFWEWSLEKHYHHFFTSDQEIIGLAKRIDFSDSLIFPDSLTSVFSQGEIFLFNGAADVLKFSPLNIFSRLQLGLATVLLKTLPPSVS